MTYCLAFNVSHFTLIYKTNLYLYMKRILLSLIMVHWAILSFSQQETSNRVTIGCQDLFVSGINIAWNNYGMDVGVHPENGSEVHPDMADFQNILNDVQAHGGNVVRWWLHVNGSANPSFGGDGLVSGIPSYMTNDMKALLDAAWARGIRVQICLWSFDMLKNQWMADPARNKRLLTEDAAIQAYINNALIPMVTALDGHPGLFAWEIFNEPEGMTEQFGGGWDGFAERVTMADIQKFVNLCAGAIHRSDNDVIVTNGAWSFYVATDVGSGNMNYYRDDRLIAAGGDQEGTLDIYNVHYYNWAGTERSPFYYNAAHWALDKPLVIAEFHAETTPGGVEPADMLTNLYNNGYAGGMTWAYTDAASPPIFPPLDAVYSIAASDIDIDDAACSGANFSLSANRICQGDELVVTNKSNGATSHAWDFGVGAQPRTSDQATPPSIIYSDAGMKTVTLTILNDQGESSTFERTLEVVSSTSSYTATLTSDAGANCGGSNVLYSVGVTPSLEATSSQASGVPGKTAWSDGATQTAFNITSEGTVPGIENASQYLLGGWHSWSSSFYQFTGLFGSNASLTISLINVQTTNEIPTLVVLIDGTTVLEQGITANQNVVIPIPSGEHTIEVRNGGNDWLQINEYLFDGLGLNLSYEWYVNGILNKTTTTNSTGIAVSVNDEVYAKVLTGEIEECVAPYLISDTLTVQCTTGIFNYAGKKAVKCYPNPFNGNLTVEGNGTLKILTPTGQILSASEINGNTFVGKDLPAGIYILLLTEGDETYREVITKY